MDSAIVGPNSAILATRPCPTLKPAEASVSTLIFNDFQAELLRNATSRYGVDVVVSSYVAVTGVMSWQILVLFSVLTS